MNVIDRRLSPVGIARALNCHLYCTVLMFNDVLLSLHPLISDIDTAGSLTASLSITPLRLWVWWDGMRSASASNIECLHAHLNQCQSWCVCPSDLLVTAFKNRNQKYCVYTQIYIQKVTPLEDIWKRAPDFQWLKWETFFPPLAHFVFDERAFNSFCYRFLCIAYQMLVAGFRQLGIKSFPRTWDIYL